MKTKKELDPKPCPFCHSAYIEIFGDALSNSQKIRCRKCLARGPEFRTDDGFSYARSKAIETWNKALR